jgi:hypothetical protein
LDDGLKAVASCSCGKDLRGPLLAIERCAIGHVRVRPLVRRAGRPCAERRLGVARGEHPSVEDLLDASVRGIPVERDALRPAHLLDNNKRRFLGRVGDRPETK